MRTGMKRIDLYMLDGDPNTVYRPLGYDACMEGFDRHVTTPVELRPLKELPWTEHSPLDFDFPLNIHSVLDWAGIGKKDILSCEPPEWIVISPRMLAALESLGPFEHKALPVRIWDELVRSGEDPRQLPSRFNDDYKLLYLPEELKIFDYRASEYRFFTKEEGQDLEYKRHDTATEADLIDLEQKYRTIMPRKIVLRVSEEQLPPIFRLKATPSRVYVTSWAAKKLTQMGLNNLYLPRAVAPVYMPDDVATTANS